MKLFAVAAALLTFFPLRSQSLIVGTPTIIRANYSVVFNPQSAPVPIAALQFTFNFVPGQVTSVTPLPGSAAVAAGKSVQCGPLNTTLGSLTCLVFGLNTNPIGVGTVANFTSTVAQNTLFTSIKIVLTCLVASDASGNPVPFPNPPPCGTAVESFTPDGVTTTFTLGHASATNVVVTINGVIQTGYTVSNGVITFATAPPCPQPVCAAITVSYTYNPSLSTPIVVNSIVPGAIGGVAVAVTSDGTAQVDGDPSAIGFLAGANTWTGPQSFRRLQVAGAVVPPICNAIINIGTLWTDTTDATTTHLRMCAQSSAAAPVWVTIF